MSHLLISRSPDLKRLRDEGYDLEIRSGHLLVKDVPYVSPGRVVKKGTLISTLVLAGDVTAKPDTHVAYFAGEHPCYENGAEIEKIKHWTGQKQLAEGIDVQHSFSAKPTSGSYEDYYTKVTTYVQVISGFAEKVDPSVTAKTFPVLKPENDESPFNYIDTASARAEIGIITKKLELSKVAIVGLGGTGSYVLDLVAKTPVKEIHLFDGDIFFQHNAFRSPGAPSVEELDGKPFKTARFKEVYSKMHRGIVEHSRFVSLENVEELKGMAFVFLCLDRGAAKKMVIEKLEEYDLPFIDVGMGIVATNGSLGGILRVTASSPGQRDHFRARVPFSDDDGGNEYNRNIQIADLNALNAALAVIHWKKSLGFYRDHKTGIHSTYTIDGNLLLTEGLNS
ncbi:MAG TPA: ThiF family adenylyltransferase [Anaerolineales bacterium]|nr:ThiF family adenylyltransferase [Anaerolineales bacterium]